MAKKQSTTSNKEVLANGEEEKEKIVQYIVVRNDLGRNQDRAFNTLISHTASAATAAIHIYYKHEHTQQYLKDLEDLDNPNKKVFQVEDEDGLLELDTQFMLHKVEYRMWIKQPENYATCIATRPYPKSELDPYFKNLKVYKR